MIVCVVLLVYVNVRLIPVVRFYSLRGRRDLATEKETPVIGNSTM